MFATIGVVSPGDMGHAVGRALKQSGRRVITSLAGRSARSRRLAEAGGLEDAGTITDLVAAADLVLSIMPPASAPGFAREAAAAMAKTGKRPHFADLNAVAPMTAKEIAKTIAAAGATFTDGGIVGAAPGGGRGTGAVQQGLPTRIYVSGPQADALLAIDGNGIAIKPMGPEIGRASAMKMVYSAMNKGALGLYTTTLIAAERLGLIGELMTELASSQKQVHDRVRASVGWLATDAERWIGEMEEIAATFAAAGVTPKYFEGAEDTYRLLAATPLSAEKRETADRTRSLEQSLKVFAATIDGRKAAE
jgi:3-hydroxyisobutyrate dehydrogenase-like beta-hydroxyacid dehydrogenase